MIYLIMQGIYSDWEVVGYFTNSDEAYSYCNEYNKTDKVKWLGDKRYVIPVNKMTMDGFNMVKLYYVFIVYFHNNNGSWNSIICDDPKVEEHIDFVDEGFEKYPTVYRTRVCLNSYNPDRAKKIAEDRFYQYLYERSLHGKDE